MRQYFSSGISISQSPNILRTEQYRGVYALMTLFVASILFASMAFAGPDDLVLGFAKGIGGDDWDTAHDIAKDSADNLYVLGTFNGTVDFDPGPGVTALASTGDEDTFVCKFDPAGALIWAKALGGATTTYGLRLAVDSVGAVYVTGFYVGTCDFDPGPGVAERTSSGRYDIFALKLDPSGAFQWVVSLGGSGQDIGNGIAVDVSGNIYVTGTFAGTVDFDPGSGDASMTSAGNGDIFILALDATGLFQWAKRIGAGGGDEGTVVAIGTAGNIYVSGTFEGTVDFNPGSGTTTLTSGGANDVFVLVLDPAGNFQWAKGIRGGGADSSREMAFDSTGNVYITGTFTNTADFDPGSGSHTITSTGNADFYVLKLGTTGLFQWVFASGSTQTDESYGLAVSDAGDVYITGYVGGQVDIDYGTGTYSFGASGVYQYYLIKLATTGEFRSALVYGVGTGFLTTHTVTTDTIGNVYTAGSYSESPDFDPSTGTENLPDLGGANVFFCKLEPQHLPVAMDDTGETDADTILTLLLAPNADSVLANDTDANTRAALTVTAFDARSALGAQVSVNADGTFVYNPTAVFQFRAMASGESLLDQFTYTVSDGTDTAVGTVIVTVNGKGTGLPVGGGAVLTLLALMIVATGVVQVHRRVDKPLHR